MSSASRDGANQGAGCVRVIDSHAHLFFDAFDDDRPAVLERARAAGVLAIVNVGIDVPSSEQAVQLARRHRGLYAAVGLHPTSEIPSLDDALARVESLARGSSREVVAVGEIGLDYYWDSVARDEQRARCTRQLELARRLHLPVIIHCRDALEDLLALLEAERSLPTGVFHCFSGTPAHAERVLSLGFHISFAGNVTFPKAADLRETARAVPLERLLLETDAPFLAPQRRRGKRNEPAFVLHTLESLAETKGELPEDLAAATVHSALQLLDLEERLRQGGRLGSDAPGRSEDGDPRTDETLG